MATKEWLGQKNLKDLECSSQHLDQLRICEGGWRLCWLATLSRHHSSWGDLHEGMDQIAATFRKPSEVNSCHSSAPLNIQLLFFVSSQLRSFYEEHFRPNSALSGTTCRIWDQSSPRCTGERRRCEAGLHTHVGFLRERHNSCTGQD